MDKLRLRKQVLLNDAPLGFATLVVQEADSSTPAKIYGAATGTVPFKGSIVKTDAEGFVEVYVNPGVYRLAVLSSSGSVLFTLDNLQPYSGDIDIADVEFPQFQPVAYAAEITPVITGRSTTLKVDRLTGTLLVNTPVGGTMFDTLSVFVMAVGTGRQCGWASGFNMHDQGDSQLVPANKQTIFEFVFDGSKWNQVALPTYSNID